MILSKVLEMAINIATLAREGGRWGGEGGGGGEGGEGGEGNFLYIV